MSSELILDLQSRINTQFIIEQYARNCSEHVLSILASTGILLLDLEDDEAMEETIMEVEQAAHEAGTMIYTVLDLCTSDSVVGKGLPDKIHHVCALISQAAGVKIEPEIAPEVEKARLPEHTLMLILVNLLCLRLESGSKSPVTLRFFLDEIDATEFDEALLSPEFRDGVCLGMFIDLPGFDSQTLLPLLQADVSWNKSTSTPPDGLPLVREAVRTQSGGIRLVSQEQGGTLVGLYFPQVNIRTTAREKTTNGINKLNFTARPGILFIDDDPLVCAVTERILSRKGFDVLTAESGEEGLELFRRKREDIAVAIIDLNMPDMNGEQVLRRMNELGLLVPVVATSGAEEQLDPVMLKKAGFSDMISKPYSASDLAAKINHVLSNAV